MVTKSTNVSPVVYDTKNKQQVWFPTLLGLAHEGLGLINNISEGWDDCRQSFQDWTEMKLGITYNEETEAMPWSLYKSFMIDAFFDCLGSPLQDRDDYATPWDAFLSEQRLEKLVSAIAGVEP